MALINLQTNLKNLSYREFGGSVTQTGSPLVTDDINKNPSINGIELQGEKRKDDLKRVTKLLTQTPAALKFAANQAALNTLEQKIKFNPKREGGQGSLVGNVLRGAGNTAKVLASTLAQIPVAGTGTHFVKGFSGKLGYLPGVQGHVEYKNNRRQDGQITTRGILEQAGGLIQDSNSKIVLDYFKKPDGGGKTRRQEFQDATKSRTIDGNSNEEPTPIYPIDKSPDSNFNSTNSTGSFLSLDIQPEEGASKIPHTENEAFTLKTGAVHAGIGKSRPIEDGSENSAYDIITARAPKVTKVGDAAVDVDLATSKVFEDLIRFRIKIISPGSEGSAEPDVTHMSFRAFLDSLSDTFDGEWNGFKYIGRAENFYTYGGFNRQLEFSFKVAAFSRNELKPMYDKLNLLAGSTAPTYSGASFTRGNFAAVTIGDYVVNQTGFFDSISLTWSTDYNFTSDVGEDQEQVPQILDVSCRFTPIHNFNPQFNDKFFFNNKPELNQLL